MKIKTGEYELFKSVTLIQIDDEEISLEIDDNIEGNMLFDISFIKNNDDNSSYVEVSPINDFHAKLLIANIERNNNFPILKIGSFKKEYELFLKFKVLGIIEGSKVLVMNFYTRKKEA